MVAKTCVQYDPTTTPPGLISCVWHGDDGAGLPVFANQLVLDGSVAVDAHAQRVDTTQTPPVLVAWVPPNPTVITRLAFLLRFTAAERAAVRASANAAVQDGLDILAHVADSVDLSSTPVQNWVNLLATQTLITAARATAILTP